MELYKKYIALLIVTICVQSFMHTYVVRMNAPVIQGQMGEPAPSAKKNEYKLFCQNHPDDPLRCTVEN